MVGRRAICILLFALGVLLQSHAPGKAASAGEINPNLENIQVKSQHPPGEGKGKRKQKQKPDPAPPPANGQGGG